MIFPPFNLVGEVLLSQRWTLSSLWKCGDLEWNVNPVFDQGEAGVDRKSLNYWKQTRKNRADKHRIMGRLSLMLLAWALSLLWVCFWRKPFKGMWIKYHVEVKWEISEDKFPGRKYKGENRLLPNRISYIYFYFLWWGLPMLARLALHSWAQGILPAQLPM